MILAVVICGVPNTEPGYYIVSGSNPKRLNKQVRYSPEVLAGLCAEGRRYNSVKNALEKTGAQISGAMCANDESTITSIIVDDAIHRKQVRLHYELYGLK